MTPHNFLPLGVPLFLDRAAVAVAQWKKIGSDPPHHELMALTACRIWRFRQERAHCSKPAAAEWARRQGLQVAYAARVKAAG